ncbi:MAG: zinc dependent phospholipase C family protein [Methanomicrobiales archaeon]
MKNVIKLLILLVFIVLTQASPATAWSVTTHHDIAREIYYSLPADAQKNLSLDRMIDGSDDPDLKFMDFKYHHYPATTIKADEWLDKGEKHYKNGEYDEASYCFGVASHYISDSFCAPHCVKDEDDVLKINHQIYELRAMLLDPEVSYMEGNIVDRMHKGKSSGEDNWDEWNKSGNNILIQTDLNHAASAAYSEVFKRIN